MIIYISIDKEIASNEDRMVVSYHPETLLINFQYVTFEFARYITKCVSKSKHSKLFEINETDELQKHTMAKRLGAMKLTDYTPIPISNNKVFHLGAIFPSEYCLKTNAST
ncbi:13433_t:CDS:2 [Entrophospora sp. SA101]|nr:13433_t:CDS:2 [Entrophospora sp. SA101]CAJ0870609.1 11674_t:CDS:2 [Entrophospora sp. SA101]